MTRIVFALAAALLLGGCSRTEPTFQYVSGPLSPPTEPTPPIPPTPPDGNIPPPRAIPVRTLDDSLAAGVAYLLKQQSADGAWRSDLYATFKDGTALTPLVVTSLQDAHDAGARDRAVEAAIQKGLAWLTKFSKPDGTIDPGPDGFDYPVYTAVLTLKAFSHPSGAEFAKHRDAWVKYLKERQLTAALGWKPEHKPYGGWGYCRVIPKKPEPNQIAPPLIESNLSATLFALDALKAADALDEETAKAAAVFVRRCQNYLKPDVSMSIVIEPLDGGFHFIYDDPVRNKAGAVSRESEEMPIRFYSYGSTTADGLRALALCNQAEDAPRRSAAESWLWAYFRAGTHPGKYVKAYEPNREAVYYYYAASVAKAFRDHKLQLPDGRDWAAELSAELARRQLKDGSWANPIELVRENEPLVASANAVSALAKCKK